MSIDGTPDLDSLVMCGERTAGAMRQHAGNRDRTVAFFRHLLHGDQAEGGKDVWECLRLGLITEIEVRDVVMAHFATWLSRENRVPEPSSDTWSSPALEHLFELALFGRPANREELSVPENLAT